MNRLLIGALGVAVAAACPLMVAVAALNVLTSDTFVALQYDHLESATGGVVRARVHGRQEGASAVIAFLRSDRQPDFVRSLTRSGGEVPLFSEDEVSHLLDVRERMREASRLGWLAATVLLGGILLLGVRKRPDSALLAVAAGGVVTVTIVIALAVPAFWDWQQFFVQFHELGFPEGNWRFSARDGLGFLFPERFWLRSGAAAAALVLGGGVVLAGLGAIGARSSVIAPDS